MKYKTRISIDEKEFFWVIVENGSIINNPAREELNKISNTRYYNKTNICSRCRQEDNITDRSILYPGNANREKDNNGNKTGSWVCTHHNRIYSMYGFYEKPKKYYNDGNRCEFIEDDGKRCPEHLYPGNACQKRNKEWKKTGEWICANHWRRDHEKYGPNSQQKTKKSISNCRTGNQNPNDNNAKGDKPQELVCKLYGYEDLNKKNDNYKSPVDCYDTKTGLFHQVRGKWYGRIDKIWSFTNLEREWFKEYEDLICCCISDDGKTIERIYRFPSWSIIGKRHIKIVKYDSRGMIYKNGWYEEYRVTSKELEIANGIWQKSHS